MHVSWNRSRHLLIAWLSICVVLAPDAVADETAEDFFDRLHQRYLELERFAEEVRVLQVVEDEATDAEPIATRTRIRIEVDGETCRLHRPTVAPRLVDALVDDADAPTEADLQLLPHLRLRFDPDPLLSLRRGRPEGFRPVELEHDELDGRPIVRLQLHSGPEEDPAARVGFVIDLESMLIDRVEGEERLATGLVRRFEIEVEDRVIARSPEALDASVIESDRDQAPVRSVSGSS